MYSYQRASIIQQMQVSREAYPALQQPQRTPLHTQTLQLIQLPCLLKQHQRSQLRARPL